MPGPEDGPAAVAEQPVPGGGGVGGCGRRGRGGGGGRAGAVRPGGGVRGRAVRPARAAGAVRGLLRVGPGVGGEVEGEGRAGPAAEPGEGGHLLSAEFAEDGHHQALAAEPQHVLGAVEPGAVGEPHPGEGVQQQTALVDGVAVAGGLDGLAGVGEQPDRVAAGAQVEGDRGGGGDRPLEGGGGAPPAVGDRPGVQQDGGPGAQRLLLPADHQLAVLGGGPPVDPAEVVALPVAAGHHVVLAGQGEGPGAAVAVAGPLPGQPDRREVLHRRNDGEDVGGGERAGQLAEPEGVAEAQLERAQAVAAAQVGAHPVGHLAVAARLHPVQDEARARAEDLRHLVLQHQHAGGRPGDVVHPEEGAGLLPGRDPTGRQPPSAGHPEAGADQQHGCRRGQRGEEHPDPQQGRLAERVGADHGGDAGRGEGAPAGGEAAQGHPEGPPGQGGVLGLGRRGRGGRGARSGRGRPGGRRRRPARGGAGGRRGRGAGGSPRPRPRAFRAAVMGAGRGPGHLRGVRGRPARGRPGRAGGGPGR